ncbi:MAG TPA: tandem-95 repeat protein [Burkholderiales bacterium]|nr:tandem-95 repeat protein [Burkholderiales bacterium]
MSTGQRLTFSAHARVFDSHSNSDARPITINIIGTNDAPVAADDALAATEDTPVVYAAADLLGNDEDVDGDTLFVASVASGAGGTAVLNGDGTITFTPNANFNGAADFTYAVSDGDAVSTPATATVNVAPVNDRPVGQDDSYVVQEDTTLLIAAPGLLGNDSDADGDALRAELLASTNANGATVVVNADGSFSYTPAPNFNGLDAFLYLVFDASPLNGAALAFVTVLPVNDAPVNTVPVGPLGAEEDTDLSIAGLAVSDLDAGNNTIQTTLSVSNGTLSVAPVGGALVTGSGTATVTLTGTQAQINATLSAAGNVVYHGNANFNGSDTLTVDTNDFGAVGTGGPLGDTATVSIVVNAVNDVPVAQNEAYATNEDVPLTIAAAGVLANDTDLDGDALSAVLVDGPDHGTLILNPDGSFTYSPDSDYNGADSFTYTANDGADASNVATVNIAIAPVNDAPMITVPDGSMAFSGPDFVVNSTGNGMQVSPDVAALPNGRFVATWFSNDGGDGAGTFLVRARLFDADGTPATPDFVVNTTAAGDQDRPSVSALSDGRFLVAWDSTDSGSSNFLIRGRAFDASGAPLGGDFAINTTSMFYNNAAGVNVLALPNDTYFVSWYTAPNGGDGSGAAVRGRFVDAAGNALASDFVINTTTVNSQLAPKAALLADGAHFVVSWWDTNSSIGGTGLGSHARILDLNGNGGPDFQLNTSITGVPGMPAVAGLADGRFVAAWNFTPDNGTTFDVRARLFNADGTPASGEFIVSSPGHGGGGAAQVAALSNGGFTVTWSSNDGGDGNGSLVRARLFDADGNAIGGDFVVESTTAGNQDAVSVTTLTDGRLLYSWESNDGADGDGLTIRARFMSDSTSTSEDTPFTITGIAIADVDAGANAVIVTLSVDHGALDLVDGAGVTVGGAGTGILTLSGSQAAINTALAAGLVYSPDADYHGGDTLTVHASDQGYSGAGGPLSATETVTLTVHAVNDAPVANDDALEATEDTPVTYAAAELLGNDTDVEGDALAIASVTSGAGGTAVLNGDGTVTFTPNANFNGTTSFTYTASDGAATSNVATASVEVAPVNDAPETLNTGGSGPEDTANALLLKGTDVDGTVVSMRIVTTPANGRLYSDVGLTQEVHAGDTIATSGNQVIVRFKPDANWHGATSFDFAAIDDDGAEDATPATASLTVLPVNDAPFAGNNLYITQEDIALAIPAPGVLANDSDVDGDALSASLVSGPAHGTLTLNADGSFNYTPAADYFGSDSFTYRALDGGTQSNTATVSITVMSVNDGPTATTDGPATPEDTPVTVDIVANDTDPEDDPLTIVSVSGINHGTYQIVDNKIEYTPDPDFFGNDIFSYTISDGNGDTDEGTVVLAVTRVNDPPIANPDSATVDTDSVASVINVLANDSKGPPNESTQALTVVAAAALNGTVTINANGTLSYTPNAGYAGPDTISYTIQDDGFTGSTSDPRQASSTVSVTVTAVNDAPTFAGTLDGAPTYLEDAPAVVLDGNVQVSDPELAAQGHYDGATLTLARHLGAHAQDVFSATGLLGALTGGGALIYDGFVIGAVTQNSGGTLVLTFANADATQARVNGVLQSIAYSNSSNNPPSSVQIDWAFSDGNTGAQGVGGALAAAGSTTVTIVGVPDVYLWTQLVNGQVIGDPFDAAVDKLRFDDAAISAADVKVGESPLIFSHGGKTVTVQMNIASITTTNVFFDDGSLLVVGDNTTATAADSGNNSITGAAGDDQLLGLGGIDTLTGGDGGDWIDGGLGNDTATGGNGDDTIRVGGAAAADTAHGDSGSDRLIVDYSGVSGSFGTFSFAGTLAAGYSGSYSNGIGTNVTFNTVEHFTVTTTGGSDSITTGDGDDVVSTGGSDDSIRVAAGNFVIDGGTGTDGLGANLSAVTTDIVLDLKAGSYTLPGSSSVANVEQLIGFTGGSGNDTLISQNIIRADTIDGGGGDDTVGVGGGADNVAGGSGSDRLVVDYSSMAGSFGTVVALTGSLATGYSGRYSNNIGTQVDFTGIEHFSVTTTGGSDSITTGDGEDIVSTAAGNDIVNAGAGNDHITGGLGNDTLNGGAGDDTFTYNVGDGVGNPDDGVDTVNGGEGDELDGDLQTVNGTSAAETYNINPFGVGTQLGINITTSPALPAAATLANSELVLTNVEEIVINTGGGGDTVTVAGDIGDTGVSSTTVTINGGSSNDTFIAVALADNDGDPSGRVRVVMNGFEGDDTLVGGDGDDRLTGGVGDDSLQGSGGDDVYIYNQLTELSDGSGYIGGALLFENVAFDTLGFADALDFSEIDGISFIGSATFSAGGQGELRYVVEPSSTAVLIDADGDGMVDRYLRLNVATDLVETAPGSRILLAGVPNTPPVAFGDFYSTIQSSSVYPISLTVAAPGVLGMPFGPGADFDADGDPLTAELVSGPSHGTLIDHDGDGSFFDGDGGFVYLPDPYFVGDDSFVYRAFDGVSYSANATVEIDVKLPPVVTANTQDNYDMSGLYADLSLADPIPMERMAHSFVLATSDGRYVQALGSNMTYDAVTNAVTGGTINGIHLSLLVDPPPSGSPPFDPPAFYSPLLTVLGDANADPPFAVPAVELIAALQDYATSAGADTAGLDAIFQTIRYNAVGPGSASNDVLVGGPFDDYFAGAAGSDRVIAGAGDDLIIGGADSGDVLTGGAGADVFQFGFADGLDEITDFSGIIGGDGDVLDLRALFGPLDLQTDILDTATYDGTDTTLHLDTGSNALTLVLRDFDISDLHPADVLMPTI